MIGRTTRVWIIKPIVSVTINMPSFCIDPKISSILATRAAIKLQTPIGEYLKHAENTLLYRKLLVL